MTLNPPPPPHPPLLAEGERFMTKDTCPLKNDVGAALSTALTDHKLLQGRLVFSECILKSTNCTGGNGELTAEEAAYHGRQVPPTLANSHGPKVLAPPPTTPQNTFSTQHPHPLQTTVPTPSCQLGSCVSTWTSSTMRTTRT